MSNVLTEDVTLKCAATAPAPHGGTLAKSGASKLRVDGHKVLTRPSVLDGTISLCGNTDTSHGQVQCTKATAASAATKLFVEGKPVVLAGLASTTNGTPPGKLATSGTIHDRLRAV